MREIYRFYMTKLRPLIELCRQQQQEGGNNSEADRPDSAANENQTAGKTPDGVK